MSIQQSLYDGQLIRLGPIDFEKDPEIESRWTHDPGFLRALFITPAIPCSPAKMKKHYEAIEKAVDEQKNQFYFTIRSQEDERLLGFIHLQWIEWNHGNGNLKLAIGDPDNRGKGYGSEAMHLMLRFAFEELNLFRLTVDVSEDNPKAIRFLSKFGFIEEVRRRKALLRDGKEWDILAMGLLNDEWQDE